MLRGGVFTSVVASHRAVNQGARLLDLCGFNGGFSVLQELDKGAALLQAIADYLALPVLQPLSERRCRGLVSH
jgi:hypothetical protein